MSSTIYYPDFLADMADSIGSKLMRKGIDADNAAEIGMACIEDLRKIYGKQLLYIPGGHAYDQYNRDMEIYEQFTGNNHTQLASKHGLSLVRIYQIIKAGRTRDIKERQGDIFQNE